MQKVKVSKNLVSFVPIRRGDWVMKISLFKDKYVLVYAFNVATGHMTIRQFADHIDAANFIEFLAEVNYEDKDVSSD
jgi:hypothetical protein